MEADRSKTEAQIEILQELGYGLYEIAESIGMDPEKLEDQFEALFVKTKKNGRPPHKPTMKTRGQVEMAAAMGMPQEFIARELDIAPKTLRKHYPNQLKFGAHKANFKVMQTLYRQATGENPPEDAIHACTIFWAKTRLGLREVTRHEMTGPDGKPIQTENATRFDYSGKSLAEKKTLLQGLLEGRKDDDG